jgi:hypothetical protein
MAEAALAAAGVCEFFDDLKGHLLDRHEHHLCDTFAWLNFVGFLAAIPAGNEDLALVVRIDQAGQVTEYEAASLLSSICIARPVGTSTVSPGTTVSASSMQARISRPAEPPVA